MSYVEPQELSDGELKILDVFRLLFGASTLVSLSLFFVLLGGPLFFELSFWAPRYLMKRPDGLFVVEYTKLHQPS